jgi:ABC-type phosphate transport system substrate-binding protein
VFTEENYPRVDGSTANVPLGRLLLQATLGKTPQEAERELSGFSGTDASWRALGRGEADLLLVYDMPKSTWDLMVSNWVEYTDLEYAPIGRDALVFLANEENPADNLTTEQILDIYSGNITNWNAVGGADAEILAYQRNLDSASQTMMLELVMGDTALAKPVQTLVVGEMGDLVSAVAEYENRNSAIGYNAYYYVSRLHIDPNVKLLSVDGVAPTNESIQSGTYPFVCNFYAAIRKDEPDHSPARILYDWLQSPQGQQLVAAGGYATVR